MIKCDKLHYCHSILMVPKNLPRMPQLTSLKRHFTRYSLLCILSFFTVWNTATYSNDNALYDLTHQVSAGYIGYGSHWKTKRGFYYGNDKIIHINYQRASSSDGNSDFVRHTVGLGYRQLTNGCGIIGVYGLFCWDPAWLEIKHKPYAYYKINSSENIIGFEWLTSKYHNIVNIYIPLGVNIVDEARIKKMPPIEDRSFNNFSSNIDVKFLKAFKNWIPTLGAYLVSDAPHERLLLGIVGKVDYRLSKRWMFNCKTVIPFNLDTEMPRFALGIRYQNYHPATYNSYSSHNISSRLLHMPIEHSDFSRFSTPY